MGSSGSAVTGRAFARMKAITLVAIGVVMVVAAGAAASGAGSDDGGVRPASDDQAVEAAAAERGYVLIDSAGVTAGFGDAVAAGSLDGTTLAAPVVDAVSTPTGLGHVVASADGGVFTFGDAPFLGSLGGAPINAPIVGVDITRTGRGYLLFAADGGVFSFGDAPFLGSLGGLALNAPVVDGALNKANDGYLVTASDGGVFTFGAARFAGSMGGTRLNGPIAEILVDDDGPGYALVAEDGGTFTFGGFGFYGSLGGLTLNAPITDAAPTSTGDGYHLLGADGAVFAFGDAPYLGSLAPTNPPRPFVAILGLANEAPIGVADRYDATEDEALVVAAASGVLANDTDDDGDPITAALETSPAHGTLSLASDGGFTYTPSPDFAGTDSFSYRVTDSNDAADTATVTLAVEGVNDAPIADGEAFSTDEDTSLTLPAPAVLDGDTDVDGDTLTAALLTDVSNGTLTLGSAGGFSYMPDADFNGTDSFTYEASDGTADSAPATVTITVDPVNDAPVATADSATATEDTPLTVASPGVLGNDTDVEGEALGASDASDPAKGSVTLAADGGFTYTPDANATGSDSFTYVVTDASGATGTGTVTITITGVNDAPAADADSFSTDEDSLLTVAAPGVLDGDSDVDGDTLTAALVTDVANGTLTLGSAGGFSYMPDADFNGTDSFTYEANDGTADSAPATVTITVDPVNDAPVATDDAYDGVQDVALVVAAPGVVANDTDIDSSSLTAGGASDPANGSVTLGSGGGFTYTPDPGFTGTDTFTYDVSDGALSDEGLVTITVVAPNAAPSAAATSASGLEDGGAITVTLSGSDDDGDALTFDVGTATKGLVTVPGAVTCDANTPSTCSAEVTYTPNANTNGSDSFTYTANDGTASSSSATASITISAVNDEPSFTKGADQTVDEDSGAQSISGWATAISAGPANESSQTVTILRLSTTNDALFSSLPAVSSTGTLTYTPAADANGSATVSLAATDDGGTADGGDATGPTVTFTITVNAVNDEPSFTKGADQTVAEDAGATSTSAWATAISKGPADESGQTLSFTTSNDNNELFAVQPGVTPTGTLVYTPAANRYGSATVTISLSDTGGTANGGDDTSPSQTFTITVSAVNDAPVAAAKSYTVQANMKISLGGLLTGATDAADVAGDPAWSPTFRVGSLTAGAGCVGCTISNVDLAAGTFDFDPPAGGTGTYSFTYTVVDDGSPAPGATSAAQTITVTVSGPVVWFVDTTVASGGTGRLSSPYSTLSAATSAMGSNTNQRIFVRGGNVTGNVNLRTNGWLVSEAATGASFDAVMGFTPPAGTMARPAVGGTQRSLAGGVNVDDGSVVRGFDISSGTVDALAGTGADSIIVNQVAVASTTGRAVNLSGGSGTVTLSSASSNGAANGIVLNGFNTTTGSFSVTGTGGAGSGGTIRNATGDGISLTNTRNVTFTDLAVTDAGGHGIAGSGVLNLTLTRAAVSGAGDADNEHGIKLTNQGGTVSVTGGTFSDAADNLFYVDNTNVSATISVSGGAVFRNTVAPTAWSNNAIQLVPNGASQITATVSGANFTDIVNSSAHLGATALSSSGASTLTFTGNTVSSAAGRAGGVLISAQERTLTTATITNNAMTGAGGNGAINVSADDDASLRATITGNTLTSPKGHAIVSTVDESADARVRIESNQISGAGGDGMQLVNFGDDTATTLISEAHYIVRNNSVSGHSADPGVAFVGGLGIFNMETDGDTVCAAVTGNTVSSTPFGQFDIYFQDAGPGMRLEENPNTGSSGPASESYVQSINPGTTFANLYTNEATLSDGATCMAP